MSIAIESAAPETGGFLRVERIFSGTYGVIRRQAAAYFWLTLAFGVAPGLFVTCLYGAAPGDLGHTPLAGRLSAMALFVLGDAILSGALTRMAFDDAAGIKTSFLRCTGAVKGRLITLLLAAAAIDVPMLTLNLVSNTITHDRALGLLLYGLRFCVGVTLGAIWCGAGTAIIAEGLDARGGLKRAAELTKGHRPRTALFFAAFFVLKVLGPYLLIDSGLDRLAVLLGNGAGVRTAAALIAMTVWNLLACALGISVALIYAALRELKI